MASSSTLGFVAKAKKLAPSIEANLGLGEPDKNPPKELVQALIEATKVKPTYTPSAGLPETRKAVAEWLSKRYDVEIAPEEVLITPSGKAALYLALLYFGKGEGVLLDPTYYSYEPVLKSIGVEVKKVPMKRGREGYDFPENLPEEVPERGIMVINSPSNPTGSLIGDLMFDLAERALERGSSIVSDEPYDVFVYEGKHVSLLNFEKWREVGAFVYSFSKVLCVPGWRLGAIVAKEEVVKKLSAAASNVYGCPCKWEQIALAEVLQMDDVVENHVREMVEEYAKRRHIVKEMLSDVAEFLGIGGGAFYAFPSFGIDSEKLALKLAEKGVITIPGKVFSEKYGWDSLRISYSAPLNELSYGLEAIAEAVRELKKEGQQH
ncbi:hypothetical protein IPA_03075 [Ignicoccus pacificus DSM 13166]|uniref:Aminotransferase class I/classII large domain-containing protein n=1 Tax=Ignicoccus pacificus DSM 13166 TaxID=940294 RepID=A0A977KAU6_9CREN|nr:hypothetical protein IPA_03075 [Ignicoccus pacificus DSM 13166]